MIKKIENFFIAVFLFPLFGGFTTVAGIIAGYVGSLWAADIANSFLHIYYPTAWFTSNPIDGRVFDAKSTLFWIIAIIEGLSFTGNFWAQSRSSNDTKIKIHKSLDNLLTLTPRDILIKYIDFLVLSNSV